MWYYISQNDWLHDPRAPWNEKELVYETCPHCNGDGGVYYTVDDCEYTKEEYEKLPSSIKSECYWEECTNCDGCGSILIDEDDEWEDL